MDIRKFFAERLYNKSGMMCDPTFVGIVYDVMTEAMTPDEMLHPSSAFDVGYDGSFEVVVEDFRLNGKNYWVFKVYPLLDPYEDADHTCVCGEAWVVHTDWETLVTELEKVDD